MADNQLINLNNIFSNNALVQAQNKEYCNQILAYNEITSEKGLILTEIEAADIVNTRNKALKDNDRIEIGLGITAAIIEKFSDSTFIDKSNYAETLNELIEIFYYVKSGSEDKISDVELLDLMWDYFENKCCGSIELMTGREIEALLRSINNTYPDSENSENDEEDYDSEPPDTEE